MQVLSALPARPDLAFPPVPGRGQSGPPLGPQPAPVGLVVVVRTPGAAGVAPNGIGGIA